MRPSTSVQCLRRAVCAERAELLLNNRIGQGRALWRCRVEPGKSKQTETTPEFVAAANFDLATFQLHEVPTGGICIPQRV